MLPATCLSLATRTRVAASSLGPALPGNRASAQALLLYLQRSFQRDALCDRSPGSPLAAHGRQRKILLVRAKRGDETVISDHRDAEVVHVHRSASGKATDVVVAASHVPDRKSVVSGKSV